METVYYVTSSLDGYIASPDGDVAWLEGDESGGYEAFIATVDHLLMGRSTYEATHRLSPEWPYACPATVATRDRSFLPSEPNVSVTHDAVQWVRERFSAPGRIWVVGGGQLASALSQESLLDTVDLYVQPTILGRGIPLFAEADELTRWDLHLVERLGPLARLQYARR